MGECDRCGIANPVWFTPSWLWSLVMGDDRGDILCPACFIALAEKANVLPSAWVLTPESGIAPAHIDGDVCP
jgi:hypothetical protein